jgi:hypothetical protein
MSWLHKWGTQVIIEPGQSTKDYVRHYIQLNSNATRNICFTHTGWRQINGKWIYLTGSGAIGVENVLVELSRELQKYCLPLEALEKEKELVAIKTGLSFLEIGEKSLTYPLFSLIHLAPLTTLLSPMPNFSGYLVGESGLFKSSVAVVTLAYFGNFSGITQLPNFSDTANNIEKRAFTLKDTLMILDDYCPSTQRAEAQWKESIAQRIIRAFSNRTGRGRLNSDGTDKGRYEPRGMLLITGEELVTLQSTLARIMVIEVDKGAVYKNKLTEIQEKLNLLPYAMASYISWVKAHIEDIQESFPKRFIELRKKACKGGVHLKLPEQVAYLTFALETALSWLVDKNVINEEKARKMIEEGWNIFMELVSSQTQRIKSEDPVQKFTDILQTLIAQGKVKLEYKEEESTQENHLANILGGSHGELIGYYDDLYFYLLPTAMWRLIQVFCRDEGSHFPIGKNTFYGILRKRGLIETKGKENIIPQRIRGKVERVLKIYRNGITENENLPIEGNNLGGCNVFEQKSNVM